MTQEEFISGLKSYYSGDEAGEFKYWICKEENDWLYYKVIRAKHDRPTLEEARVLWQITVSPLAEALK